MLVSFQREKANRMEHRPITLHTAYGTLTGLETERCRMFLGVPYAHARRFEYAIPVDSWDGVLDATAFGPACPQNRAVHEHLENPVRRFYRREFREGAEFRYDEDCLNLNIFAPRDANACPVVVFIHGGGFDSGLNCESVFDGSALAERGIVTVFINYRVGVLGWLTHRETQEHFGRDGNFGLDDMLTAIRWVKAHIADFGGDPENLTLLGQSAGAISIQFLCLNHENKGLFRHAAMLSGAGLFPKFARPRRAEDAHAYWEQFIEVSGCKSLDELRALPVWQLFDTVEAMRALRSDAIYYTMPVVDGLLLPAPVDELIQTPLHISYLIGFTSNDMYAPLLALVGSGFGKQNSAFIYYFDLEAPGDGNGAFHSCDLRYLFETLDGSWRRYGARDYEASAQLAGYLGNFARCGDPNGPGLPRWERAYPGVAARVLRFAPEGTAMGRASYGKLTKNALTKGEPKV
ncbi:MAG: carboxylesterase family protein [Ruminococcaceae bacterium]|nr:carboxylesterase family protein [Oscillospiraceae bacterium]